MQIFVLPTLKVERAQTNAMRFGFTFWTALTLLIATAALPAAPMSLAASWDTPQPAALILLGGAMVALGAYRKAPRKGH